MASSSLQSPWRTEPARTRLAESLFLVALATSGIGSVTAHEHHMDKIPEGEAVSAEPLDSILWIHILMQITAFGLIFPFGMVLGMTRNRWHVPVQIVGTIVAVLGYFLGHLHGGRQFAPNVHAKFANILMLSLIAQVCFGMYLKLHWEKGFHGKLRRWVIVGHGINGKAMPLVSWVQMLFGGITALGFCRADHFGQCLAHFIMGSAFIAYGIVMTILMLVGQVWLRKTGRSQEFFDSALIAAWGCVNTFTEHRWGQAWGHNDLQHTTMGIIWWCAGLLGVWLSRKKDGRPQRNLVPGLVIFVTGWAMSSHPQHLMLSTMIHGVFGYTLMAAGLTRVIEVAFVLKDKSALSEDGDPHSFQYIPPLLLYASGFLFLSATEEQMALVASAEISHVSYVLVVFSFAVIMFLVTNLLIHTWIVTSKPTYPIKDGERPPRIPRMNGHRPTDSAQIRDVEEFELAGLMSDEEDILESPSTVGKNYQERVD